jgi:regulator of cell morphogenesis and NO signaling
VEAARQKSFHPMTKIMCAGFGYCYYCQLMESMFLKNIDIRDDSFVTDIVVQDYRTARVFRKYAIDFCCGGKLPLAKVCEIRGLNTASIKKELIDAMRTIQVPSSTSFNEWTIDFLVDYIINVHHAYLTINFPEITDVVERFSESHKSKFPFLAELVPTLHELRDTLLPLMEHEEKIIFPYIRQIAHAYENHEPYAALLVRTLRKPVENMVKPDVVRKYLHILRDLTNNYKPVSNACISHKVAFSMLNELDNDLVQHIHLESNILLPKAIAMEKEMLSIK